MVEVPAERACPVVVRRREAHQWELLAFEHPSAGLQLVKGRINPGESPAVAACRELLEESGLVAAKEAKFLFTTNDLPDTGVWHFYLCDVPGVLPESWNFMTMDDGGQCFRFFWQPIDTPLCSEWHPMFHQAIEQLRPRLQAHLSQLLS